MDKNNNEIRIIIPPFTIEKNIIKKKPLDKDTKEWSPSLDTVLPIDGSGIPNFKAWVNWNGFQLDRKTGEGHDGFDFAAYITTDNRIVLGLPEDTKIRAVADGVVTQVLDIYGGYATMVNIEHGANDSGMLSRYSHVRPTVETGASVKKGDVIGELYKDHDGEEGRLVHLHLSLISGWGTRGTSIRGGGMYIKSDDPRLINPSIYRFSATPQGSTDFTVPNLPNTKVEFANFKRVRAN